MEIGKNFLTLGHQILQHLASWHVALAKTEESKKLGGGNRCVQKPEGAPKIKLLFSTGHPPTPMKLLPLALFLFKLSECSRNS